MDDQLNNELRNRIIEVFDGYETPAGAADAGWAELRKRFPEKKKHRAAAWWWSSVAAFLAFTLFGLWLYNRSSVLNQTALIKNNSKHPHLSDTLLSAPETLHPTIKDSTANDQMLAHTTHASGLTPAATQFSTGEAKLLPGNNESTLTKQDTTATPLPSVTYAAAQPKQAPNTLATAGVPADTTASAKTQPALAAIINKAAPDSSSTTKRTPTMADLLARDSKTTYQQEQPKSTDKKLIFSVFAGTYVNYAKGSSNQLNAGAGLTSDIRLMKKLKLVTGIAIAQNSLKYDGQPTQPNVYAAAIAATGRGASDNSAMRLFSMPGFATTSTFVSTEVSSYNASFTGLDIPVNLKFEINPDKNDSYISAGISSGTFINETYHYNYTNSLVSATTASAETQTRFGSFDFARTLNLSFGVGTPLGKSNRLIIEPFLKYPLSGLGSQQIRFGASGINLKLRFQTHK